MGRRDAYPENGEGGEQGEDREAGEDRERAPDDGRTDLAGRIFGDAAGDPSRRYGEGDRERVLIDLCGFRFGVRADGFAALAPGDRLPFRTEDLWVTEIETSESRATDAPTRVIRVIRAAPREPEPG